MNGHARRRPHLLVLNQYYTPGVEATAHLLGELCAELAKTFDVTVVTGMLRGADAPAGRRLENGIDVVRVPSTTYDRRELRLRALNYVTYLAHAVRIGLRVKRPDVVLCMTDPPVVANVALIVARRFRVPLVVVSQDVFPEIAVRLNRLKNPVIVRLLRALIGSYLRRADRVVAIGETMRTRLVEKGAPPERVEVIANWVDTERLVPLQRDNAWAREHGLTDRFVVMHSGNIGHAQNLDALVRSAMFLRDLDRLSVVLIGAGARLGEFVALAELFELDSVRFLEYQSRALLSQSLSAAHVHVVGLAPGLSGFVVPSRLYGILAVGRPVIVASDFDSEAARLVAAAGCGIVVPPGRPDRLAEVIRDAYDGELPLDEMGRRGREYVVATADRQIALGRYRDLLLELATGVA